MLCVVKLSNLGERTRVEAIGHKFYYCSIANHYPSTLYSSAAATVPHRCWRRCQILPGMFIQVPAGTETPTRLPWRVHIRMLSTRFAALPVLVWKATF